jgi:hypothetical protein
VLDFLWQASLNSVGPVVTMVLAAVIGQRLSSSWAERQKRRELEFALANSFYTGYGEFCSIWKYWNQSLRELADRDPNELKKRREALLDRACRAEGAMEAVLLKIAAERVLDQSQKADLGNLRQAYQVLRERIEQGIKISYGVSQHPDYLEFKRLATLLGVLLTQQSARRPTPQEAFSAFETITHNSYEYRWRQAGKT